MAGATLNHKILSDFFFFYFEANFETLQIFWTTKIWSYTVAEKLWNSFWAIHRASVVWNCVWESVIMLNEQDWAIRSTNNLKEYCFWGDQTDYHAMTVNCEQEWELDKKVVLIINHTYK